MPNAFLSLFTMGRQRELSQPIRAQITALRSQGLTERAIASTLSVSKTAVHQTIVRHGELGSFESRKRGGRPRATTRQDDSMIRRAVVKEPTCSASEIQSQLPPSVNISVRTIRRRLQWHFKLRAYRPAIKPLRSAKNVTDRVAFCHQYKHWTIAQWKTVMFSDETMIRQFYSFMPYVRRPWNQRYNSRFCVPTAKYSPSIMIWGSISCKGTAGLWFMPQGTTINAATYLSILQENLPVHMPQHNCTILQHDGAPCHSARTVRNWLAVNNYQVLERWPGSSPDLNPIEHCWALVKKKVMLLKPTSRQDLQEKIKTVWEHHITPEYCHSLIESMPSRILAVLAAKGGNTRY
jgi:transposase